jgi:hypothetical protein
MLVPHCGYSQQLKPGDTWIAEAEKHGLRGYDATQLASAFVVHAELLAIGVSTLVFLSADGELNDAAQAEQLLVQNPNNHP